MAKWNDDRGFGFITPAQGMSDIFVHVSAFDRRTARPQLNELVSFETEVGPDGKLRAVRVMRPGEQRLFHRARQSKLHRSRHRLSGKVAALLAVAAIGTYSFGKYQAHVFEAQTDFSSASRPTFQSDFAASFQCDGRMYCSQMSSCAEATFFLNHCPNTKMDGDHDGIPCEQQLCAQ